MDFHEVKGDILHLEVPTPTVETAAAAVGSDPDQIVKSVLFLVDGKPVLAVACGLARVDQRAIASRYGVGRKRVKLADSEKVLEVTGFLAGAVPPFGHPEPIPTLLDPCIRRFSTVFAGGGTLHALVRLSPEEILRMTQGEWLSIQEHG